MDPSKNGECPTSSYQFNTAIYPFPLPSHVMPVPNFSVPPPPIQVLRIPPVLSTPFQGPSAPPPYGIRSPRQKDDRQCKYKSASSYEPKRSRHNEYQRAGSTSERSSNRHSDRNRGHSRDRDRDRERNRERERGQDRNRYSARNNPTRQSDFRRSESHLSSRPRDKNRSSASSSRKSSYSPSPGLPSDRSHRSESESQPTERERLLSQWRSNYCETSDDIAKKLELLVKGDEKECWIRSSPAELYYKRNASNEMESTARLDALCNLFDEELIKRGGRARAAQPTTEDEPKKRKHRVCRHKCKSLWHFPRSWWESIISKCFSAISVDNCSSSDSSEEEFDIEEDCPMVELTKKIKHPYRLHADLWHNESGEMNDGPLCRCSVKSRRTGIRHGIYPGENGFPKCSAATNNAGKLYHYRITISPPTNFLTKTPTIIKYDQHEFIFEGFSLLSHQPIGELPTCKVIRFNIEYTIMYVEEAMPENFTIRELDLFCK